MKNISYRALSSKVLAVLVLNDFGTKDPNQYEWRCYIGSVKGWCYEEEFLEVAETGDSQPLHIAMAIFPNYEKSNYGR